MLRIADVASHAYTGSIALAGPRGVVIGQANRTAYVTLAEGSLAIVDIHDLSPAAHHPCRGLAGRGWHRHPAVTGGVEAAKSPGS
jgi:ribosomal protein S11